MRPFNYSAYHALIQSAHYWLEECSNAASGTLIPTVRTIPKMLEQFDKCISLAFNYGNQ